MAVLIDPGGLYESRRGDAIVEFPVCEMELEMIGGNIANVEPVVIIFVVVKKLPNFVFVIEFPNKSIVRKIRDETVPVLQHTLVVSLALKCRNEFTSLE